MKRTQTFLLVITILLILSAVLFSVFYIKGGSTIKYRLGNKYYGFEIRVPKNWIAEQNTSYQEGDIGQLIDKCKNSTSGYLHEIGDFRIKDQRLPEESTITRAILEISVDCMANPKLIDYSYGDLKIGGENAFKGFSGLDKTIYFSFMHNNLQYKINEYVLVSPSDKNNEQKIRNDYSVLFDKIITSFKFIK
ncbi:MAG: hypothetical protein NT026_00795 [Candidatus Staskawiczbacteria bacterium]|nr:hypothetical protein [Candidatus Staskawiczbacteria bacterium]